MKTASAKKFPWPRLLGCCLALWLAGCAPRIFETPYVPPPPPPKPAPPPQVSHPTFYVAASRLNLRGCPGMDCPKISILEQNDVVEKIGEMDDWCEVIVKRDGSRGWVTSRYLSAEPVTPAVEAPPPPAVTPPPPLVAPAPPPVEKPAPVKPPVVEKPKPAKPAEPPAPPKKKPEEPKPAKPGEPAPKPAPKPAPEKPEPPAVKPAPPEKPAPPKEPEPEQPKKIRIM